MYLSCYTQDEIAEAVNMPQRTLSDRFEVLADLEKLPNSPKLSALYQDEFEIPIFLHILQSGIDQSMTTA